MFLSTALDFPVILDGQFSLLIKGRVTLVPRHHAMTACRVVGGKAPLINLDTT
jgi:hypothetical protein